MEIVERGGVGFRAVFLCFLCHLVLICLDENVRMNSREIFELVEVGRVRN